MLIIDNYSLINGNFSSALKMNEVCREEAHEKSFGEFSKFTDEELAIKANDSSALLYRGAALAQMCRYHEAEQAFSGAARFASDANTLLKMLRLSMNSRNLASFPEKYARYVSIAQTYPKDWYKERLLKLNESGKVNWSEYLDLLRSGDLQQGVYILGPPQLLAGLNGIEGDIYVKFRTPIQSFPFAQADHEGYMYQKDQTVHLPFGTETDSILDVQSIFDEQEDDGSPIPIALFPRVAWESVGPSAQAAGDGCDVWFGDGLVRETTHRMLLRALDQMAAETQVKHSVTQKSRDGLSRS
jgi:hypothetical protein